jgi:cation:H+ antiporter
MSNDALRFAGPSLLSRLDGLILIGAFTVFLGHAWSRRGEGGIEVESPPMSRAQALRRVGLAVVGLPVAAHLVVAGATELAVAVGISDQVVGLTLLSAGTSLPELATTVVAGWRGEGDLAVGNLLGSTLFNLLLVLGVSCLVSPVTYLPALNLDGAVFVVASLAVALAMVVDDNRISSLTGGLLVLGFIGYLGLVSAWHL